MARAREARAVVVVPPEAGKRLIGRAVARLPQVQEAKESGLIVVGWGTTNAYVLEELLGRTVAKERYVAGYIAEELRVLPPDWREPMVVLDHGEPKNLSWAEIIPRLSAGDVIIKGGNALDPQGVVGVYVAGEDGGTVGKFLGPALAKGVEVVIPISRAKSVHFSVLEMAKRLGHGNLSLGPKIGVIPLLGTVVTETEAVSALFGVKAEHIGGGGVGRGAGAVVLLLSGPREAVEQAFAAIKDLAHGEPPLSMSRP